MKYIRTFHLKVPTGIIGFDENTGQGLPSGRTTLLGDRRGSGKTRLALQFLVHGAQDCREPGIFVAFEATPKRIVAHAEGFGWKLVELRRNKKCAQKCAQFCLRANNQRRTAVVDQAHFRHPAQGNAVPCGGRGVNLKIDANVRRSSGDPDRVRKE